MENKFAQIDLVEIFKKKSTHLQNGQFPHKVSNSYQSYKHHYNPFFELRDARFFHLYTSVDFQGGNSYSIHWGVNGGYEEFVA